MSKNRSKNESKNLESLEPLEPLASLETEESQVELEVDAQVELEIDSEIDSEFGSEFGSGFGSGFGSEVGPKIKVTRELIIPEEMAGLRLDQAVSQLMSGFSRALIQEWIKAEKIKLNGAFQKNRFKVSLGDKVLVDAEIENKLDDSPEDIPLNILFEDEDVLVVNKPVGLVVHPGAGNARGTLMNALLHHCPLLRNLPRAGIVHRLDKDTSGLMVIAKNHEARQSLIDQLQLHEVSRIYIAFVHGYMVGGFTVEEPIGRNSKVRTKMAVVSEMSGKPAVTHVRVLARSKVMSMLEVDLETGRTHQIRVHLSYKGYPLIGDLVYGGRRQFASGQVFEHQALHAKKLSFMHPRTEEWVEFDSEIPEPLQHLEKYIKEHPGH